MDPMGQKMDDPLGFFLIPMEVREFCVEAPTDPVKGRGKPRRHKTFWCLTDAGFGGFFWSVSYYKLGILL